MFWDVKEWCLKYVVVKEQLWFSKIAVGNSKNKVWISKIYLKRKEGNMTQSCDETPYTNRQFKNELTTQKRHQNFDYTTIVDWLGIVSWSNNSYPTVVVIPLYGTQPSH